MTELLFKDLSYRLTGLIFEVNNQVGYGQSEKTYSDCFEKLLQRENINYQREVYFPIKIDEHLVKKEFFDFLIDDQIVIELKISDKFYKKACGQIFKYLKSSDKKLGIIFRITKDGVRIKRIPNYY